MLIGCSWADKCMRQRDTLAYSYAVGLGGMPSCAEAAVQVGWAIAQGWRPRCWQPLERLHSCCSHWRLAIAMAAGAD